MIKKYKDNIESLNKQIVVATKKIEKKDSNNELQFIDFHQLQIENKKYVKEVDEKNKLLLKLKPNRIKYLKRETRRQICYTIN